MKKVFIILLMIFLSVFDACIYARSIKKDIAENVIRLHIIANDDTTEAQEVKLKIRDEVLKYMEGYKIKNYSDAYIQIEKSKEEFENIARKVLKENGFEYDVFVELGEYEFPTKKYDKLSFPAGKYTAIRICLGEAKGKNWWCVMYPSLCFTEEICEDEKAYKELKRSLNEESFSAITGKIQFKFKILELFGK